MRVCLVAAMARNRVIGRDGDLPWHLPADLQAFKAVTLGKPVIMGHKTWASIGKPLPGRLNIVISSRAQIDPQQATVSRSFIEALEVAEDSGAEAAMVIGGAAIYQQALPFADELILTVVQAQPEGDRYFPAIDETRWSTISRTFRRRDEANAYDLEFLRLVPSAGHD